MRKSKLFLIVAVVSGVAYFYYKTKEGIKNTRIDGLDIKVNPTKLLDGALALTNINPLAKEGIRQVASRAINKFYENND